MRNTATITPSIKQFNCNMPFEDWLAVRHLCGVNGVTLSALVRHLLSNSVASPESLDFSAIRLQDFKQKAH